MPKSNPSEPTSERRGKSLKVSDMVGDLRNVRACGLPGSGKTQLYLSEVVRANEKVAPDHIIMCVIDMDLRGVQHIAKRVLEKKLQNCVEVWPVGGSDPYDDAWDALNEYAAVLVKHQSEHPDGLRFLVVESEDVFYNHVVDRFVKTTSIDGQESLADAVVAARKRSKEIGKNVPALGNPRDAYWAIYAMYDEFMFTAIRIAQATGSTLYSTYHLIEKLTYDQSGNCTGKHVQELGKPDRMDGYFDVVVHCERSNNTYIVSTETQFGKDRLSAGKTLDVTNKNASKELFG